MSINIQLAEVFDRGFSLGIDALSPEERRFYRIQEFIIEYEMGGLTGYLSNRFNDSEAMNETVEAMHRLGLSQIAALLDEARQIIQKPLPHTGCDTWGEMLGVLDPPHRIDDLHRLIDSIPNYGLNDIRSH